MTNPLANEKAIYVEWVQNDGGAHVQSTNPPWWLSPDVQITGPLAGQAQPGVTSNILCRAHAKDGVPIDGDVVFMEVFVSKIGVSITPPPGSTRLGVVTVASAGLGPAGAVKTLKWTPPLTEPIGHKCLVMRAFPENAPTPSQKDFFFTAGDPHIAQHNIDVVAATTKEEAPGLLPPGENGLWNIPVGIANGRDEDATVGILVDRDPEPDIEQLFPAFTEQIGDFVPDPIIDVPPPVQFTFPEVITVEPWRGIDVSTRFPDGVHVGPGDHVGDEIVQAGTDLSGLTIGPGDLIGGHTIDAGSALAGFQIPQNAVVGASGTLTLLHRLPAFSRLRWTQLNELRWQNVGNVEATLPPATTDTFHLAVDLRSAKPGTSQVYHLQQTDERRRPQGGLTLIVVRMD